MKVNRQLFKPHLLAILLAGGVYAPATLACPLCTSLGEYGTDTNTGIAEATQALAATAADVSQGFAANTQAIVTNGNNIVSALNASANTMTTEFARSNESRSRLLEALRTSMEELERSRLVAEANKEAAESHGEENLPMELCEAFSRREERELAKQTATRLVTEHKERQLEDRAEEYRSEVIDPYSANAVSVADSTYTEQSALMAMEQASVLTGEKSFPVSPDLVAAQQAQSGDSNPEAVQLMSAWLRTSNASTDLATQISKRTKPTVEGESGPQPAEHSLIGDLWAEVESTVSPEAAADDTSASEVDLLRRIARRTGVNNRIRLEQLENQFAMARMSASQLGYLNEKAMRDLSAYLEGEAVRTSVSNGGGGE